MKILYFYQYFTTPKGAYSTRVYEFAQRWLRAGDSVTVVTSVYDKSDIRTEKFLTDMNVDGINLRVIKIRLSNRHGKATRLLTFFAYALVASWYALVSPADVVVSSSGPLSVAIPGLVARYVRRRRFIFEVRDLWPDGAIELGVLRNPIVIRLARILEKISYQAASHVVVLSQGMADWIRSKYHVRNIVVVPNASDNELMSRLTGPPTWPPGFPQSKQLILYAGTMGKVNDCGVLIDMCRYLKQWGADDVGLVVVGDGKDRPDLERAAESEKLDNISFLDSRPKLEVLAWLKSSCCTLLTVRNLPVLATCSPNKLFDAFAAGTPIIQNTIGWMQALLEEHQCGISVPPDDPEALARAVLTIARDKALRETMSRNALRLAREEFDRDLLAGRMRQAMLSAVASGG